MTKKAVLSLFFILTFNVGIIKPASIADITSRLKTTGQEWMTALQHYSPNMTSQEKQRLITLTKRTSTLIGAFLLALGTAYAVSRWEKRRKKPTQLKTEEMPEQMGQAEAPSEEQAEEQAESSDTPASFGYYGYYNPQQANQPSAKEQQQEQLTESLLRRFGN